MKILIADDSEILRKHLTNLLTEIPGVDIIGYAEDTESAIAGIETENLDAAIIDIRMPGAGGIQVLKTVRQAHPDLRIIIFTDYPYPQYRKKCFEEGADYFFDKSTESEKLVELIRKMVRGEA
ncbi:MAG: response regulator transcription factor [Candidatus Neomarinimicrobiota bacterium]|jgi:DNA-binding NarL/FixJ family response regulator